MKQMGAVRQYKPKARKELPGPGSKSLVRKFPDL